MSLPSVVVLTTMVPSSSVRSGYEVRVCALVGVFSSCPHHLPFCRMTTDESISRQARRLNTCCIIFSLSLFMCVLLSVSTCYSLFRSVLT